MSTATETQSPSNVSTKKPEIRVYNTLSKTKEPFKPLHAPKVGIY